MHTGLALFCRRLVVVVGLTLSIAYAQDAIPINEGLSGTWFNPDTPGQGFV